MRLRPGPPRIDAPVHVRIARRGLAWTLRLLAGAVLRRYRPIVVSVTGSVGKTTTKDLTAAVLATRFRLRATEGNSGGELGAPTAVLGGPRGRALRARALTLVRSLGLLLRRRPFPELLVLEMAAGRPGELERVTRQVQADVAVVTNVRPVHREHYPDFDAIVREKSWPIRRLRGLRVAVLNADDPASRELAQLAPGRVIRYRNRSGAADVWVENLEFRSEGASAVLRVRPPGTAEAKRYPLTTRLLGAHQLSGLVAAVATGVALGVPPEAALAAVADFEPAPGRLRALRGADGLVVLDDCYNASPQAVLDALEVLARFPQPRWAVLGDMAELGPESEPGHRAVGESVARRADALVAVGRQAAWIAEAAVEHGMNPDDVYYQPDSDDAAHAVATRVRTGTVLVKGSAVMRLERVVAELVEDFDHEDIHRSPARRRRFTFPSRGIPSRRRESSP
jgi:UDP-N-acetylmuramoyl-tripeptide--D-alanyl-D-alanine ligase